MYTGNIEVVDDLIQRKIGKGIFRQQRYDLVLRSQMAACLLR